MGKIKAVLFDLGGTLLYFDGELPRVLEDANLELLRYLQGRGVMLDGDYFLAEFRRRLDEYYVERDTEFVEHTTAYILRTLLTDMNVSVGEEELAPALRKLYGVSQAHWKVETDTIATLSMLQSMGLRMGIISNASDDEDVQTLVDNAAIRPYFDFILTSAACGIRKPNPRIFEIGVAQWGLPANEAAVVGDTLGADILGARNAGMFSVWITRRADKPGNHDHLDTIAPDATIGRLGELPALLHRLV
jgi:HAD superfamily hydrolase (TIGR01549 family)